MEGGDVGGNPLPLVVDRGKIVVTFAGEVDDLDGGLPEMMRGAEEKLVDAGGPLAPPHHEERRLAGIEPEGGAGGLLGEGGSEITPHGRAGDGAHPPGKGGFADLEAEQNAVGPACGKTVGAAGDGIRLVQEAGDLPEARREERRGRSEPTHSKNGGGLVARVKLAAGGEALPSALQEAGKGRGEDGGHADGGEFLPAELGMVPQGHGVDLLLGDEQKHAVSALVECLGHGKPREEVPPRAAAGDDELFGNGHGLRCAGPTGRRARPDAPEPGRSGCRCGEC